MQGKVIQVNISPGGVPKRAIPEGRLTAEGFVGDSWRHPEYHGGPMKAVLLVSMEVLDDLSTRGFPVFAGATGENLTTEGMAYSELRIGDRLRVGDALLEKGDKQGAMDVINQIVLMNPPNAADYRALLSQMRSG